MTKEDKTEEKLAQKISTIIEGVLNQDISEVKNPEIKAPINRQRSKVVKEAIISAMVKKVLEGELKKLLNGLLICCQKKKRSKIASLVSRLKSISSIQTKKTRLCCEISVP